MPDIERSVCYRAQMRIERPYEESIVVFKIVVSEKTDRAENDEQY
ncbi:hypothetical protein [Pedobacter endophyticus]|nr:hypothetical protein [Pedobacter endophyticus]